MKKESIIDDAELKRQLERARAMNDEDIDTSDPDAHVIREDQLASARPFREVLRERKMLREQMETEQKPVTPR